jgi:hypothetical protein
LILPFLPLARVAIADRFLTLGDFCRECFVAVDALFASRGKRRQR